MILRACPREKELTAQLRLGHWPEACSADLRAHVDGCKTCRDLMAVTLAFRGERAFASAAARLESPGALWWRAQLRRRNAALERIARPVLGAQIFAVVLALVAAGIFLAIQARQGWFTWLADLSRAFHIAALLPPALQNSAGTTILLVVLFAAIAVAGGFVAVTTSEKR